jgi:hypothetical protein
MAINKIHKIEGVNFVKPSDIFAKLFAVIQKGFQQLKKYIQIKVSCLIIA